MSRDLRRMIFGRFLIRRFESLEEFRDRLCGPGSGSQAQGRPHYLRNSFEANWRLSPVSLDDYHRPPCPGPSDGWVYPPYDISYYRSYCTALISARQSRRV